MAGSAAFIDRVRFFRKQFGGGLRQSGLLAAAAIYALDHNIDRLAEDHANARRLAEGLAKIPGLQIDPAEVETNIVIFAIDPKVTTAADLAARLKDAGIWMLPNTVQKVRAVTHLDVTADQIDQALATIRRIMEDQHRAS